MDAVQECSALFDVRSPGEFARGHIPGATSLPLFSDEERAHVGTLYKQSGHETAFTAGLRFACTRAEELYRQARGQTLDHSCVLYCARGGLRSASVAKLLQLSGLQPTVFEGGYKAYRRWVLETLAKQKPLIVLGGLSGSGKTEALRALRAEGYQVLDLELLACHRGSAFGHLGQGMQPTNEHFENLIATEWDRFDERPIFIEDESRLIGRCMIPDPLFTQMKQARLLFLSCPKEERLQRLKRTYATLPVDELKAAVLKISKRLGDERTRTVISLIEANDALAIEKVLDYYDKTYLYSLKQHIGPVERVTGATTGVQGWIDAIRGLSDGRR